MRGPYASSSCWGVAVGDACACLGSGWSNGAKSVHSGGILATCFFLKLQLSSVPAGLELVPTPPMEVGVPSWNWPGIQLL